MAAKLLGSKVMSDVFESLNFVSVAVQFQIRGAKECLRHALGLVWSREQQVREALVSTYSRIYLVPTGGRLDASAELANNLLSLVDGASYGELTSLKKLLGSLPPSTLPSSVEKYLWDIFKRTGPQSKPQEVKNALLVLSMVSKLDQTSIRLHLDLLIQRGLGTHGPPSDLVLARYVCTALQEFMSVGKKKGLAGVVERPSRLPPDHPLFQQLVTLMVTHVTNLKTSQWCPFAEQAVSTIYRLAEHPDMICATLVKALASRVLCIRKPSDSGGGEAEMNEPMATSTQGQNKELGTMCMCTKHTIE